MNRHDDQTRVWDLIDSLKFAMLVTHDGEGDGLRARPMHAHGEREEDAIYFLTDRRHYKDDEIRINDNVCLAFADSDGQRYLSVSGSPAAAQGGRHLGTTAGLFPTGIAAVLPGRAEGANPESKNTAPLRDGS